MDGICEQFLDEKSKYAKFGTEDGFLVLTNLDELLEDFKEENNITEYTELDKYYDDIYNQMVDEYKEQVEFENDMMYEYRKCGGF